MLRTNAFKRQRGQAMIEFSVSVMLMAPFVIAIIMLLVQWALVYKEKVTLNGATFEAARFGALNHGAISDIRSALAQGMMPLFMGDDDSKTQVVRALARANVRVRKHATIEIINPTRAVFNAFKTSVRYYRQARPIREIPNDNLMYRSSATRNIGGGQMNIQDANLLKIKVNWCKRLEVPIANWIIGEVVTLTNVSVNPTDIDYVAYTPVNQQLRCNALGAATGDYYVAIESYAIVRMQTPFRI